MADLIVGHTTANTTRIWVRGDKHARDCHIDVQAPGDSRIFSGNLELSSKKDYTGTLDFAELKPDTDYLVTAKFRPRPGQLVQGRFHTLPWVLDGTLDFSFVLSSCNLPVVRINNLLAFLLGAGGTMVANYSLDLPIDRWRFPKFVWLRRLLRTPVRMVLQLVAGFVKAATDLRQPGQPYLRSPFLKLAAVFDSTVLQVVAHERLLPSVGDIVSTPGASGVVACAYDKVDGSDETWRFVITHVEGTFEPRQFLSRRAANAAEGQQKLVGPVQAASEAKPWYDPPAFFLHAGDQIYYDFPTEGAPPELREYRLAYQEAWFDDNAGRYLLSHWPHYMTLDDHEIADQFARDFVPPCRRATREEYLEDAVTAYREYAQSRDPSGEAEWGGAGRANEEFSYAFSKGNARFFVLDTRLQRFDLRDQMIDEDQMKRLLHWMDLHRDDLKFVVTSVPFVAEINENPKNPPATWTQQGSTDEPRSLRRTTNPVNDKWSAKRFRRQRGQIIDYIAAHEIERLVFLTGDMHCCYHATMQVGEGSRYESITVHELAGGPANQLQLADSTEFHHRHIGETIERGTRYDIVLEQFHSEVNAVMHIKVKYKTRDGLLRDEPVIVPEVEWNVIRTLTDNGSAAWISKQDPVRNGRAAPPLAGNTVRAGEPTMAGRITFVAKRNRDELVPWAQ